MRAVISFAACVVVPLAALLSASAQTAAEEKLIVMAARAYDIPVQPLHAALGQYTRESGAQVLYESALAVGRHSARVKGQFPAEKALARLLVNTGLVAIRTDIDAFVVRPAPVHAAAVSSPRPDTAFLAALQNGVLDVLCSRPQTRPGGYAVAIELWIGSAGAVRDVALIGSTGNAERDALLRSALRDANIGAPPPGIPQPFVLTIAKRSPHLSGDCTPQAR